ncbi:MAG TPA: hypothetical protein VF484_07390 [Candidatus Limnocylindrales bacterium]
MALLRNHHRLAVAGALFAALTLAGAAAAGSPPYSTHASATAVTHAAGAAGAADNKTPDEVGHEVGSAVATAAQSTLTGGKNNNHGGYVSCVARGGSNCTTTTPTLPTHGKAGDHGKPSDPGKPSD